MTHETEYQLNEFREEQKELFDSEGKQYKGIFISERQTEMMLNLINQMEVEILKLEKQIIQNIYIDTEADGIVFCGKCGKQE